ncbi:MAG: ATP-binding protein [Polyangia bacterium]
MQQHPDADRPSTGARERMPRAKPDTKPEPERQSLHAIFMQMPVAIAILEGPQHTFTFANAAYLAIVGGRDVLGKPLLEALPELRGQGLEQLMDQVVATGVPYVGNEVRICVGRRDRGELHGPDELHEADEAFFNFVYSPKRAPQGPVDGVFVTATEVTDQVRARQRAEVLAAQLRESEERLRRVVEASGTGTWELDVASGRLTADARHRTLLELPDEGPISLRTALKSAHLMDRQPLARAIADAIEGKHGGHFVGECRIVRGTEIVRWIEGRGQVICDPTGRPARLIGTSFDISERKAAEERRARQGALNAQVGLALTRSTSERRMLQECADAIVSHLDVALARIWLLNPTDNTLELQASAGDVAIDGEPARVPLGEFEIGLLGGTAGSRDRAGASAELVDLADLADGAEVAGLAGAPPSSRSPVAGVLAGPDPAAPVDPWAGSLAWARHAGMVSFAGYPLLLGDMLVGVVALFAQKPLQQDTLDSLKQLAGSLALGIKRLRAESELRTRADFEKHLLGIVSHDLRNPLNAILLSAMALGRSDNLDPLTAKTVLRIQSSAERAARMIRDLLDFTQARLGSGIRITRRSVDLREVVRSVLDEVEAAHPGREIGLRSDGDVRGEWDGDRIAQVVQNLVTNALKYSPAGSPVRVSTCALEGWATLDVHNLGAPIPPEKQSSIFEPLMRATAEVDRTGRSIGLGLYIVRQIAEAHGGTVAVRSCEGDGTTFTVRLPR